MSQNNANSTALPCSFHELNTIEKYKSKKHVQNVVTK